MQISVVIPTYNRSTLLINAIQSVLKQTYPVYEVLVCDDGSTDNSKQLVEELNDPKITWIDCGKNGRPAIPRNIGIKKAKGDWIAFLDNDDEWLPEKLQEQINCIEQHGCKLIGTNAFAVNENGKRLFFETKESGFISFQELVRSNVFICSSVLCEKKILMETLLFPEEKELKALEDYVLWLMVSDKAKAYFYNKPLLNYLDVPSQSIRNESSDVIMQRFEIFSFFKKHKKRITKKHLVFLYIEFKGQYKTRLKRLFDIERITL